MPADDITEQGRDEEVDVVRAIVLEDVSAAQDAHQVIVSTSGNPVSATRVSAETRALQWAGQMSDDTVQQLSRGRGSSPQEVREPEGQKAASFEATYGRGKALPK